MSQLSENLNKPSLTLVLIPWAYWLEKLKSWCLDDSRALMPQSDNSSEILKFGKVRNCAHVNFQEIDPSEPRDWRSSLCLGLWHTFYQLIWRLFAWGSSDLMKYCTCFKLRELPAYLRRCQIICVCRSTKPIHIYLFWSRRLFVCRPIYIYH